MIAALYVAEAGCYSGLPSVEVWGVTRDARLYAGPYPVVAHPPCQRWGRFWHGSTRKPHQFAKGDDGGCFASALASVRRWGGVIEHPADSHAWPHFGLATPPRTGGWVRADAVGGLTCYVEQGHYGHFSRKATWLYVSGGVHARNLHRVDGFGVVGLHKIDDKRASNQLLLDVLPELVWGPSPQRLHPLALERYGYEKARRIGVAAMIGGKRKVEIREATPVAFRDVLLSIARTVQPQESGA